MIESIFEYSLRSALVLTLLYIPYMLMLRQESFFRLNRIVLLLILLLSMILPFMNVQSLAWDWSTMLSGTDMSSSFPSSPWQILVLPEVSVYAQTDTAGSTEIVATPGVPTAFHWVAIIYIMVTAGVILWRLWQIVQINRVVRCGSLWHQTQDGVHIYCHADDVSPYSWMQSVVISERDYRENGREILLHEMAHIRSRHSMDRLILALVQSVQWWNPLVYILGTSLRDVHEYQADDSVLRHGISARAYQLLLIKKVVGSSSYAFANNFDHSLIIKRITMMQKSKSSKWMFGKVLYILPMTALALSAFASSPISQSPTDIVGNDSVTVIPELRGKVIQIRKDGKANGRKKTARVQVSSNAANMNMGDSTATVQLNWQKSGAYDFKKLNPSDIVSVNVVKDPKLSQKLANTKDPVIIVSSKTDDDSIVETCWTQVQYCYNPGVLPEFQGGNAAMLKYLQESIRYPAVAQAKGIQGRVFVEFLINPDGTIREGVRPIRFDKFDLDSKTSIPEAATQAYINSFKSQGKIITAQESQDYKKAVEALLDEATRVVSQMPKWNPGYRDKEKKEPCTVRYVMPIFFRLKYYSRQ